MKERIKKLRKILNLTQQEFADKIGSNQNNITNYETGRRLPSAAALNNICKTFNVNEEWLRSGEGEMFIQMTRNEEIIAAVENMLSGKKTSFKQRLISVLSTLKEEQWETLENYLKKIVDIREEPDLHTLTYEQQARAEAEEYTERIYQQILAEKKAAAGLSQFSDPESGSSTQKMA